MRGEKWLLLQLAHVGVTCSRMRCTRGVYSVCIELRIRVRVYPSILTSAAPGRSCDVLSETKGRRSTAFQGELYHNVVTHLGSSSTTFSYIYRMLFSKSPHGDAASANSANILAEGGSIDFLILDIRSSEVAHSIRDEIIAGLQPCDGKEKSMPLTLLYDEIGLQLFEAITFSNEVLAE